MAAVIPARPTDQAVLPAAITECADPRLPRPNIIWMFVSLSARLPNCGGEWLRVADLRWGSKTASRPLSGTVAQPHRDSQTGLPSSAVAVDYHESRREMAR